MEKIKYLFLVVLASLLIIPFSVFAEGEESEETAEEQNKEVIVYFFRGEGCSHCAEAEAWFESIEEELGSKFEIKDYETWYNQENSELMQKVAKARHEEERATGVPYIIIGDQSWVGFDSAYADEIKGKINELYNQEVNERYDIMSLLDTLLIEDADSTKKSSNDIVSLIIILIICGGIGYGIYRVRETSK